VQVRNLNCSVKLKLSKNVGRLFILFYMCAMLLHNR
jgi:hypothetical protein